MALISTLLLGGMVWYWGLFQVQGRGARGIAGSFVWVVLFLVVASLAARAAAGRGQRSVGQVVLDTLACGAGGALVLIVGVPALGAGDFGISDWGSAIAFGWLLVGGGVLLAAVSGVGRTWFLTDAEGGRRHPRPLALIACMAPVLAPALALHLLKVCPLSPYWSSLVSGRGLSGIAFQQAETLAPFAALIVAAGLDVADGSKGRWLHSVLPALSAVLLLACVTLPVGLGADDMQTMRAHLLPEWREGRLPVDELGQVVALMLLVCAAASADLLRNLPRSGRGPGALALLVLAALPIGLSVVLVPRWGPVAAPLGAAAGAALAWLLGRLMQARRLVGIEALPVPPGGP